MSGVRTRLAEDLAGSLEHQQKVQLKDNFELDEKTKDGDDEMLAQFAREHRPDQVRHRSLREGHLRRPRWRTL